MMRNVLCALALSSSLPFAAQAHFLTLKAGTIAATKADEAGWDAFSGAPDPFVKLQVFDRNSGQQVDGGETMFIRNSYTPVWNVDMAQVEEGDLIKIQVWDKDLKYDDAIGEYEFVLTSEHIASGVIILQFGQVQELRFSVQVK